MEKGKVGRKRMEKEKVGRERMEKVKLEGKGWRREK